LWALFEEFEEKYGEFGLKYQKMKKKMKKRKKILYGIIPPAAGASAWGNYMS